MDQIRSVSSPQAPGKRHHLTCLQLPGPSNAERSGAGLKHQLVNRFFRSLDDWLLATYERHKDRHLARLERPFCKPGTGSEAMNQFAAAITITSTGSVLGLENAIGTSGGRIETRRLVQQGIGQHEPEDESE